MNKIIKRDVVEQPTLTKDHLGVWSERRPRAWRRGLMQPIRQVIIRICPLHTNPKRQKVCTKIKLSLSNQFPIRLKEKEPCRAENRSGRELVQPRAFGSGFIKKPPEQHQLRPTPDGQAESKGGWHLAREMGFWLYGSTPRVNGTLP